MIFLQDNAYLTEDLKYEDVKPRLLGALRYCPFRQLAVADWLSQKAIGEHALG